MKLRTDNDHLVDAALDKLAVEVGAEDHCRRGHRRSRMGAVVGSLLFFLYCKKPVGCIDYMAMQTNNESPKTKTTVQKSIRLTEAQFSVINNLTKSHPAKVHTFADGLKAAIVRPKWLPAKKVQKIAEAFE